MSHFSPLKGYSSSAGAAVPAGYVGQLISASLSNTSATAMTTAVAKNVLTITLTPGVYDISGYVNFYGSLATPSELVACLTATSSTISINDGVCGFTQSVSTASGVGIALPMRRVVVTTNTPYYLVARATFSSQTVSCSGFIDAIKLN